MLEPITEFQKLKYVSVVWQKLYESNQTETAGRMFQFNYRDLDGSFEGETKQTTK